MMIRNNPDVISYGEELSPGGVWSVYSRYDRVVNFIWEDRLISVCASVIPSGVGNLRLSCHKVDWVQSLEIQSERVILNGASLPLHENQLWRVPDLDLPKSYDQINDMEEILAELAPPCSIPALIREQAPSGAFDRELARQFRLGLGYLECENYPQAASMLKGRGYGSTPSGSDLLAGYLLALAWLERHQKNRLSEIADLILLESLGSDVVSNAFARRARALKPDSDWADLLLAIALEGSDVRPAIATLISHGATSGADALMGFLTALRQHAPQEDL